MTTDSVRAEVCIRFYNGLLNRAEINLKDAQKRGDTRAEENIKRKISIYRYTVDVLKGVT